jgi:hypothetical protein
MTLIRRIELLMELTARPRFSSSASLPRFCKLRIVGLVRTRAFRGRVPVGRAAACAGCGRIGGAAPWRPAPAAAQAEILATSLSSVLRGLVRADSDGQLFRRFHSLRDVIRRVHSRLFFHPRPTFSLEPTAIAVACLLNSSRIPTD